MSDITIEKILGLAPEVLEEAWTDPDNTHEEEIRVLQRCLVLLGYPTGDHGQPWIDGLLGPATRRALKQYQEENGLEITGRFDDVTRPKLQADAAAYLLSIPEMMRFHSLGQLNRVSNIFPNTPAAAVQYYHHEAKKRVPAELIPAFLALFCWANDGITAPALDLPSYLAALREGHSPKEARRRTLRYGFLQMTQAQLAQYPGLEVARAVHPGDLEFHFDTLATVLQSNAELRQAAELNNGEMLNALLPWLQSDSTIKGPQSLPATLEALKAILYPPAAEPAKGE